jgi:hypothetical protein
MLYYVITPFNIFYHMQNTSAKVGLFMHTLAINNRQYVLPNT